MSELPLDTDEAHGISIESLQSRLFAAEAENERLRERVDKLLGARPFPFSKTAEAFVALEQERDDLQARLSEYEALPLTLTEARRTITDFQARLSAAEGWAERFRLQYEEEHNARKRAEAVIEAAKAEEYNEQKGWARLQDAIRRFEEGRDPCLICGGNCKQPSAHSR